MLGRGLTPSSLGFLAVIGMLVVLMQHRFSVAIDKRYCSEFCRCFLVVHKLHGQYGAGQAQGDQVGRYDGPCAYSQAIHKPQRNADGKQAVHGQRDAADIFGAKCFPGLGHKADGGQASSQIANGVVGDDVNCHRVPSIPPICLAPDALPPRWGD